MHEPLNNHGTQAKKRLRSPNVAVTKDLFNVTGIRNQKSHQTIVRDQLETLVDLVPHSSIGVLPRPRGEQPAKVELRSTTQGKCFNGLHR